MNTMKYLKLSAVGFIGLFILNIPSFADEYMGNIDVVIQNDSNLTFHQAKYEWDHNLFKLETDLYPIPIVLRPNSLNPTEFSIFKQSYKHETENGAVSITYSNPTGKFCAFGFTYHREKDQRYFTSKYAYGNGVQCKWFLDPENDTLIFTISD
jgi:hypothetical protein